MPPEPERQCVQRPREKGLRRFSPASLPTLRGRLTARIENKREKSGSTELPWQVMQIRALGGELSSEITYPLPPWHATNCFQNHVSLPHPKDLDSSLWASFLFLTLSQTDHDRSFFR
ncbi:hypothetical protein D8B26_008149 [Coccidioides posadasii str. Silveira]|uniref:uncharacterized protein n=1 Tax=Coccidioides posadasii (strain RMSCC 757 / Silveira) TaxID=443226 RepID=UPI001BEE8456|nr:hypothetical protein D8B26_008149 [Coccidioides posadasii str. Silveira]